MSARDRGVSTEIPAALDAEGPLRRWSRRKREAVRGKEAADEARGRDASRAPSEAVQDAREPASDAPAPAAVEEKDLTDEDMPPIDSLDENSDYSGFLSPGVSEGLRRRALRKLFMSAVFNVRDGLDDYDEDFTNFEALGDIVTSDMRHQAEAEAERARRARADTGSADLPENDPVPAETGPTADAAKGEADAARADAAEDEADAARADAAEDEADAARADAAEDEADAARADAAEGEAGAARADAAGVPAASGHRPSEETGVPESASGEDAGDTGDPASDAADRTAGAAGARRS